MHSCKCLGKLRSETFSCRWCRGRGYSCFANINAVPVRFPELRNRASSKTKTPRTSWHLLADRGCYACHAPERVPQSSSSRVCDQERPTGPLKPRARVSLRSRSSPSSCHCPWFCTSSAWSWPWHGRNLRMLFKFVLTDVLQKPERAFTLFGRCHDGSLGREGLLRRAFYWRIPKQKLVCWPRYVMSLAWTLQALATWRVYLTVVLCAANLMLASLKLFTRSRVLAFWFRDQGRRDAVVQDVQSGCSLRAFSSNRDDGNEDFARVFRLWSDLKNSFKGWFFLLLVRLSCM